MYCQKCGKETDSNAAFCSSCGAPTDGSGGTSYAPPSYGPNTGNPNMYAPQKSTGIGIILAFLIPGAGHMYAGKITEGIMIFILYVVLMFTGFLFLIPLFFALILWIWNIYDANKKIKEYNDCIRRTGNPPW
jgi:Uncharacterized protein conserved in bacteria